MTDTTLEGIIQFDLDNSSSTKGINFNDKPLRDYLRPIATNEVEMSYKNSTHYRFLTDYLKLSSNLVSLVFNRILYKDIIEDRIDATIIRQVKTIKNY